jgi:hypothetical protein
MYLCDLPLEFTWLMNAIEIAYSKQLANAIGIADFVITMMNSSCCGNGCKLWREILNPSYGGKNNKATEYTINFWREIVIPLLKKSKEKGTVDPRSDWVLSIHTYRLILVPV